MYAGGLGDQDHARASHETKSLEVKPAGAGYLVLKAFRGETRENSQLVLTKREDCGRLLFPPQQTALEAW